MAKKRSHSERSGIISPLNPALHYIVFLILALVLILVVAGLLQKTAQTTRARLVCPQAAVDPVKLVEELSRRCPTGVEFVQDNNTCGVWVCRLPRPSFAPLPTRMPLPTLQPWPTKIPRPMSPVQ